MSHSGATIRVLSVTSRGHGEPRAAESPKQPLHVRPSEVSYLQRPRAKDAPSVQNASLLARSCLPEKLALRGGGMDFLGLFFYSLEF